MASCDYPEEEWGAEFLGYLTAPIRHLPADWRARVQMSPPPAEPECEALTTIIQERSQVRADILAQAVSRAAAILPLLQIVNPFGPPARTRTLTLVDTVLDEVLAPTFRLKLEFHRGRPRQCCVQPLDPMFRHTDLDPLHPAYPSGHSVQAHATAAVLALVQPQATADLRKAAARVARNREVAGLHYPSDSAAGATLADQLVGLLIASPAFQAQYIAPAVAEW